MEFDFDPRYGLDGTPIEFVIRGVYNRFTANDENVAIEMMTAGVLIKIREMLRNYRPIIANNYIDNVQGYLSLVDLETRDKSTWDGPFYVGDITPVLFGDILEKIQQSARNITFYDIEIHFVFDTETLLFGSGADGLKKPLWVKKVFEDTWVEQFYLNHKLNCAAYALAKWENQRKPKKLAWRLQLKLGWGEFVDDKNFQEYVDYYPDRKIVLLTYNVLKGISYCSDEWVYDPKKIIYVYAHNYFDGEVNNTHYALLKTPIAQISPGRNARYKWCDNCDYAYTRTMGHVCEETECPPEKYEYEKCKLCDFQKYPGHKCGFISCKHCRKYYGRNSDHLCPLVAPDDYDITKLKDTRIIGFDIETIPEKCEVSKEMIERIEMTSDGKYKNSAPSTITFYNNCIEKHVPIYIAAKDIFGDLETGEPKIIRFFGRDCIKNFVRYFMAYNGGDNILLSHNGSGYDTRLMADEICKNFKIDKISNITRGSKIIQFKAGKLRFLDTLLHLPGSLKKIGKEFGCKTEKGFFPFKFYPNNEEFEYVGDIPGIEYFGIEHMRSDDDYNSLLKWHSEFKGEWDYKKELIKYCDNDVEMLCTVVEKYMWHYLNVGIHPWLKATGPGVAMAYTLRVSWKNSLLEHPPPPEDDLETYKEWLDEHCRKYWYVVQTDYEHNFARAALRGGRTENKVLYYECKPDEKIVALDVVSLYPSVQINFDDLPIGVPTKHVFDDRFLPCTCKRMSTENYCNCSRSFKEHDWKYQKMISSGEMVIHDRQPLGFIGWFGVVCVDLLPPDNLLHPVLILYDNERKKCISTLEPEKHKMIFINTPSFHKCLEMGYKVLKVYSFHEYQKKNLFKEPTLDLFLEKLKYSFNVPSEEKRVELLKQYSIYGQKFCKKLEDSFDSWEKSGSRRFIAKIALNSVWGKHAQRNRMVENFLFNPNCKDNLLEFKAKMTDVHKGNRKMCGYKRLGKYDMVSTAQIGGKSDIHGQYLPAASFIPEYGRLIYYEKADKLQMSFLYGDTDSNYSKMNINEIVVSNEMPGGWSQDYPDKRCIAITAFGAKTYALLFDDGSEVVKTKGVSLCRAVGGILNFASMKKMALDFIENEKVAPLMVPQSRFVYNYEFIRNDISWKAVGPRKEEMKGKLINGYIYPFGYNESLLK